MLVYFYFCFFFKQKTAYEMRISDWSSDVCSSDLCNMIIENCWPNGNAARGVCRWTKMMTVIDGPRGNHTRGAEPCTRRRSGAKKDAACYGEGRKSVV